MQNCRSSLPARGNKGESGGERQKEQLLGIDPPIPAFLSSTSMFWFGESFVPPICFALVQAGKWGGMVSQVVVVVFFFCMLS